MVYTLTVGRQVLTVGETHGTNLARPLGLYSSQHLFPGDLAGIGLDRCTQGRERCPSDARVQLVPEPVHDQQTARPAQAAEQLAYAVLKLTQGRVVIGSARVQD